MRMLATARMDSAHWYQLPPAWSSTPPQSTGSLKRPKCRTCSGAVSIENRNVMRTTCLMPFKAFICEVRHSLFVQQTLNTQFCFLQFSQFHFFVSLQSSDKLFSAFGTLNFDLFLFCWKAQCLVSAKGCHMLLWEVINHWKDWNKCISSHSNENFEVS